MFCVFTAVRATPRSILHSKGKDPCKSNEPMGISANVQGVFDITYSYSVSFTVSNIKYPMLEQSWNNGAP